VGGVVIVLWIVGAACGLASVLGFVVLLGRRASERDEERFLLLDGLLNAGAALMLLGTFLTVLVMLVRAYIN